MCKGDTAKVVGDMLTAYGEDRVQAVAPNIRTDGDGEEVSEIGNQHVKSG